ncbi:MAG: CobW family GTP-binding protein [Planctomycetota bacterium]|jgi:G3E family GTPase
MPRVALDILTGFLGSGKTSLLKHVLDRGLGDHRVAIILNEIGDVAVDGREMEGRDVERMVELDSGCVCCQINFRFAAAVQEIIDTVRPDLIILETTGVADPVNVAVEAEGVGLMLDAIVTVVDAAAVEDHLRETSVAKRQIQAADFLVLNKLDLVDDPERRRAFGRLKKLNARAPVFETTRGHLPHPIPFATSARTYRDLVSSAGREHLADDGIGAFTWEGEGEVERRRFEKFLDRLPRSVWRAKGIVRFAGASWPSLFSYASGRYEIRFLKLPGGGGPTNRAVFIGKELERVREGVLDGLLRALVTPAEGRP